MHGMVLFQLTLIANANANDNLAVMVFIHGGGFAEGSGNDLVCGPDFLVEKGVILVTINYRLGILGFLSLDLPEYSGNMGLKDQQLALKWTHQNIEYFGGDKNRITIFGQSAGNYTNYAKKNRILCGNSFEIVVLFF